MFDPPQYLMIHLWQISAQPIDNG